MKAKRLREGSGFSSVHLRTSVPTIGQRPNEAVLSAHVGKTGFWEAKNLKMRFWASRRLPKRHPRSRPVGNLNPVLLMAGSIVGPGILNPAEICKPALEPV